LKGTVLLDGISAAVINVLLSPIGMMIATTNTQGVFSLNFLVPDMTGLY